MLNWLRELLELDAEAAIDLGPDEKILFVIGRHWIVLLTRMVLPLMALVVFGGLVMYRAAGGTFLLYETSSPIGLDALNWLLAFIAGGLMSVWLLLYVRGPKTRRPRQALLLATGGVLLLLYYRYTGGRVFAIQPELALAQRTDVWNILLIILVLLSVFLLIFTFYDWLNDELILTNQRVVFDNDQVFVPRLIEQRVQQQIFLEDVQDVNAKTNTYPQHILKYGTITVKSARFGGDIVFESASQPMEMQRQIMDQVCALRKRMTAADYQRMIDERIYGKKGSPGKTTTIIKQTRTARWLNALFPENPEVDEKTSTITWRPHWLFMLQAQIGPTLLLAMGLFVVALANSYLELEAGWIILATSLVVVAYLLWAAWEFEDYRNDKYILALTNVVDIEKKPFGPEDRRQASLAAITNVRFETTFISNLLGYGDVVLETAGAGGKFTFLRVPRPNQVVSTINEYIVNFRRAAREKNLNDTLDLLAQYHEAQKRYNEINPGSV
ncbi:MAG: PH domain-containing protein [Chloroflexaceae bacterium]